MISSVIGSDGVTAMREMMADHRLSVLEHRYAMRLAGLRDD